jgi:hypothetical protein
MSTIYLDTEKIQNRQEAYDYLKDQQIQEGDEIKILTAEERGTLAFTAISFLVMIAIFFYLSKGKEFGDKVVKQMFGDKSNEDLEKEIEEQYGIFIEVEQKDKGWDEWTQFAAKGLASTYGEDEPDYSDVELKEKNPNYEGPAQT